MIVDSPTTVPDLVSSSTSESESEAAAAPVSPNIQAKIDVFGSTFRKNSVYKKKESN